MAGPILNLIRQLQENRMGGGMGFDRPRLFQPMGLMREQSPAREPATRVGRLIRSIGTGSSRQNYMANRRGGMKPMERVTANDAADPDTTYSRLNTSTAIDPDEGAKMFTVAAKSPAIMAPPQAPAPGNTQELPAPAKPLSQIEQLVREQQQIRQRMLNRGQRPMTGNNDPELYGAILDNQNYGLLDQEIQEARKSLPFQQGQYNDAAASAFDNNNWAAYESVLGSTEAVRMDAKGMPVESMMPKFREIALPVVSSRVSQILADRGGLAGATPDERNRILSGMLYAYNPTIDPAMDDRSRYAASLQERDRILREMSIYHNLEKDPDVAQYFHDLATVVVGARGGLFDEPPSFWNRRSSGAPQVWGAAPSHP